MGIRRRCLARKNHEIPANERGLTLVEIMLVLAIVAVLAAVAVPVLSRDSAEDELRRYVRVLVGDLRRARYEALSSREDRVIMISDATHFRLEAVVPGGTAPVAIKRAEQAPNRVEISGVLKTAAEPGSSYTAPGTTPAQIRFNALNEVQVETGASAATALPLPGSATIFLQTTDGQHQARIVVFGTTAYARVYQGW